MLMWGTPEGHARGALAAPSPREPCAGAGELQLTPTRLDDPQRDWSIHFFNESAHPQSLFAGFPSFAPMAKVQQELTYVQSCLLVLVPSEKKLPVDANLLEESFLNTLRLLADPKCELNTFAKGALAQSVQHLLKAVSSCVRAIVQRTFKDELSDFLKFASALHTQKPEVLKDLVKGVHTVGVDCLAARTSEIAQAFFSLKAHLQQEVLGRHARRWRRNSSGVLRIRRIDCACALPKQCSCGPDPALGPECERHRRLGPGNSFAQFGVHVERHRSQVVQENAHAMNSNSEDKTDETSLRFLVCGWLGAPWLAVPDIACSEPRIAQEAPGGLQAHSRER